MIQRILWAIVRIRYIMAGVFLAAMAIGLLHFQASALTYLLLIPIATMLPLRFSGAAHTFLSLFYWSIDGVWFGVLLLAGIGVMEIFGVAGDYSMTGVIYRVAVSVVVLSWAALHHLAAAIHGPTGLR